LPLQFAPQTATCPPLVDSHGHNAIHGVRPWRIFGISMTSKAGDSFTNPVIFLPTLSMDLRYHTAGKLSSGFHSKTEIYSQWSRPLPQSIGKKKSKK
jgi:hypothetical protein